MVQFHALGGIAVTDGGQEQTLGGARQRRLLAMLLIHRDAVVSLDRLAEAVFAGEPTAAAATTLRSYIARIRRVVDQPGAASMVVTRAPGYVLRVPPESFDVTVFERLVADAAGLLGRGDAAAAAPLLREALARWRGAAYAEFADEDWARPEAQRLTELRLVALERLAEAELASGRAAEMVPEIEALVRENPLREAFRAQLMTATYRAGRHADALRAFQEYRDLLVEELGLDPSPTLCELERRVLNHDPALLLDAPSGQPLRGYRLGERLGTGRSGTVFAARLPGVERDFAIRVIRADIADSPEFVRTFEAAVHRAASLRHPAIVPIHDYWREPGAAYVVMRRMHGGTLADRLERGPLGHAALAAVVGRIGAALSAAVEAGVVHGQVSPQSVLFDAGGEPYLSDFALAPVDPQRVDDGRDFALLVQACLPAGPGAARDLLDRVLVGHHGGTSLAALVPALMTVLTGAEAVGSAGPPNPYKGLRAFDEADAADFFGRDGLVAEILHRLSDDGLRGRLVLVVGGSGTGKSSVVRAGLLPRVRARGAPGSDRWLVTTMLPGSSPFKELAESLRRVAVGDTSGLAQELAQDGGIDRVVRRLAVVGDVLLVVDQFEELFTLASEQQQRAFLRGILDAVSAPGSRLRVVATLRADFYDRPLAVQPFGAVVRDATVTIPAMLPAELEAAIVEPVERVGASAERGLVTELVSAVVDQPAALPSLQFALYELAERAPTRRLTRSAYRALGGIDGAIASRAETLYSTSDDRERASVRRLFEHLVTVSVEGEPTRRRASRTELSGGAGAGGVDDVIDRWVEARLLTTDRHPQSRVPTVEVAHEALLREWPRLRGWIEEDREALIVLGRLRDAAASWEELGREQGALYRGARLENALEVAATRFDELPALEREFVVASKAQREQEATDALASVARQSRANRRLRLQLAVTAVALVVALVGGFVAVDQRGEARDERQRATARELAAAAEASIDDDPELGMLLALAAIDVAGSDVPPQAVEALHRAVTSSRVVLRVPGVGGALDWSRDGIFVTEGPEDSGVVDLRDAATGESVRSFRGHAVDINAVSFSADGTLLATTGDDGALRVWDPDNGDLVLEHVDERYQPGGDPFGVLAPAFTPDGSIVVAGFGDALRGIDVDTGDVVLEVVTGSVSSAAVSPDGRSVALGGFDSHEVARVVDIASGEETARLGAGEEGSTIHVAWAPDGRSIATVGNDTTVRVWDARSGGLRFSGSNHTATVSGVDWAPAGDRLATVSEDGTAVVWEVTDQGLGVVLELGAGGRSQGLWGVAFSPDGTKLMAGDLAVTTTTIWDIGAPGGGVWPTLTANPWSQASFTPGGQLARNAVDGTIALTDPATGELLETLGPVPGIDAIELGHLEVSGDGAAVAGGSFDGPLVVWDLPSATHRFTRPFEGIYDLTWSPDGAHLAVVTGGDTQGEVVVLDRAGEVVSSFREERGQRITSLSFSPDGGRLATTQEGIARIDPTDMPVTIWDWASGEVVGTIDTAAAYVVSDPAGGRLASSRRVESIVDVWDAESGAQLAAISAPAPINDLVFSADGRVLATAHPDGTVRIWDPRSGVLRLTLSGAGGEHTFLAISPDGTKLATFGADGLVRVWALEVDDLVAIATARLTRGLTDEECRQYLHVSRCPSD